MWDLSLVQKLPDTLENVLEQLAPSQDISRWVVHKFVNLRSLLKYQCKGLISLFSTSNSVWMLRDKPTNQHQPLYIKIEL